MLTRRLLPWLFALTLLFGQAAAFAHSLTHLDARDGGMPEPACEVCVAQANLGSAAPAATLGLPAEPRCRVDSPAATPRAVGICPSFSRARAPPACI